MMNIPDSPILQGIILLALLGLVVRFFRRLIVPLVLFLVFEIGLFILFPSLLLHFVNLVTTLHASART
jgi:hypothetical protein